MFLFPWQMQKLQREGGSKETRELHPIKDRVTWHFQTGKHPQSAAIYASLFSVGVWPGQTSTTAAFGHCDKFHWNTKQLQIQHFSVLMHAPSSSSLLPSMTRELPGLIVPVPCDIQIPGWTRACGLHADWLNTSLDSRVYCVVNMCAYVCWTHCTRAPAFRHHAELDLAGKFSACEGKRQMEGRKDTYKPSNCACTRSEFNWRLNGAFYYIGMQEIPWNFKGYFLNTLLISCSQWDLILPYTMPHRFKVQ